MVVSIGLFHGLVFLPVLLSIFGPRAYIDTENKQQQQQQMNELTDGEECSKQGESSRTSNGGGKTRYIQNNDGTTPTGRNGSISPTTSHQHQEEDNKGKVK